MSTDIPLAAEHAIQNINATRAECVKTGTATRSVTCTAISDNRYGTFVTKVLNAIRTGFQGDGIERAKFRIKSRAFLVRFLACL